MKPKEKDLNLIIDKLCEGKGEEYKSFVKKMIISVYSHQLNYAAITQQ